jgi:hypothetical protein
MRLNLNKLNENDYEIQSQLDGIDNETQSQWGRGYGKSVACSDSIAHKYHILSFKKKFMISLNISLRFTILLYG